jgi:hypothetical protein
MMPEIMLTKQQPLTFSESELEALRDLLFRAVGGLDDRSNKAWRHWWKQIVEAEVGEVFSIETWFPRSGPFHRYHMSMETRIFKSQERFPTMKSFRDWCKIGMGFVEWYPGPRGGGIIPIPKSISYRQLDEEGMREFHDNFLTFMRTGQAQKVLWPSMSEVLRSQAVEILITGFQ